MVQVHARTFCKLQANICRKILNWTVEEDVKTDSMITEVMCVVVYITVMITGMSVFMLLFATLIIITTLFKGQMYLALLC